MYSRKDFVDKYAEVNGTSKKDAAAAVEAFFATLKEFAGEGEGTKVQFVGKATFEVKKRAARKGRNPQTGEEIDIAESTVLTAKFAKTFLN